MARNKIIIYGTNTTYTFSNEIRSGNCFLTHAMVGETLAADEMSFVVESPNIDAYVAPGMVIDLLYDNNLVSRQYVTDVRRVSTNAYSIKATSVIGILARYDHLGGMYNTTAAVVLNDILSGVPHVIDSNVASATIRGYLPIQSRRDNLQQVLFAIGATVKTLYDGSLQIAPMSSVSSGVIDASRTLINGSVNIADTVDGVQLTEHNYIETGETVVLFEDGIAGTETIYFDEPYHSITCSGGTLVASGANFAQVRGNGTVTVTGKKYVHITRVVSSGVTTGSRTLNIKRVNDAYLANPEIAQKLSDRVFSFFQNRTSISQDFYIDNEMAGDVVSVINPYTRGMETATINSLDINLSSINKASGEFLVGYVPEGIISGYKYHAMLTGSGNWTVPSGVTKIRAIMVGGGSGGYGSYDGKKGQDGTVEGTASNPTGFNAGTGGAGGKGGKGGSGGKILEMSFDVRPGQVISFSCGVGGTGGQANTNTTNNGTETTFNGMSSNGGRVYNYGYVEPKTGLTFGTDGVNGVDGGRGGDGTTETYNWQQNPPRGTNGQGVESWSGGSGSQSLYHSYAPDGRNWTGLTGMGGGGATRGANGTSVNIRLSNDAYTIQSYGVGANAVKPANASVYGGGGNGASGAGGGGGSGYSYRGNSTFGSFYAYGVAGGEGGKGAAGGNGGNGCIVLYY